MVLWFADATFPTAPGLDPSTLPAVIAVPLAAQLGEAHPVMRLHRLCDALETLTRFATLVGWMDLHDAGGGRVPDALVARFAGAIMRPTFGMWAVLLGAVARATQGVPGLLVPELSEWALDVLLPRLGTGAGDHEREVIPLRKVLAHGGGFTHAVALGLLAVHEDAALAVWRAAAFFTQTTLAQARDVRLGVLRGTGEIAVESDAPATLVPWLAAHARQIVLARDERAIALCPLVDFDIARLPGGGRVRESTESSALVYLRAEPEFVVYSALWGTLPLSQRADVLDAFRAIFHLAPARRGASRNKSDHATDFKEEIRADAERLVGRAAEFEALRLATGECESGVLWVTGAGGMGKTILLARVARDLSNATHYTDLDPALLSVGKAGVARAAPEALRKALVYRRLDLDALASDPAASGLAPGSVDCIVLEHVLYDVADLHGTLARLRELLAPGGALLFTGAFRGRPATFFPCEMLQLTLASYRRAKLDPPYRSCAGYLSASEWALSLSRAGFDMAALPAIEDQERLPHGGVVACPRVDRADRDRRT
jgi:SAM-dependent methyltransferase